MYNNDDDLDSKKTKTSENFNRKMLSKKRQFSNDLYDPETMKDFTRFTDVININTFGSQPIVMYKKMKRLQSPIEHTKCNFTKEKKNAVTSREKVKKNNLKNNYISDGGLFQKLNKYKTNLKGNLSQSPSKKIKNNFKSKTNRDKENILRKEKTQKQKNKTKEYIPKTTKETNYKQIFKKARLNPNSNNLKKEEKKVNIKESNKYMTDKNTIEHDDKKKNEYINNLIKNVVDCLKKDYIAKKKNKEQNKKVTEKKIDYLKENRIVELYENQLENGIVNGEKSEDQSHFKIKKIKPLKKFEKININNINNINNNINFNNLHTDNDRFIYNNLTSSNNNTKSHEFSKLLIKSKIRPSTSTNIKFDNNIDNKNLIIEAKKKNKPHLNQFEFLEKIRCNFKKIKKYKKEKDEKDLPELINNSFRTSKLNKSIKNKSPGDIPYKENENENEEDYQKKKEFLYADKVTHRTHLELDKFLKKKKL